MPEDEQRRSAIRRLLAYIEEHYAEKLTLENLADFAQYNRTYVSTLFKQVVGVNFHEYLSRVRFQHALSDLALTNDGLTDIALRNGFADLKTFNARFRSTLHRTPTEYRAQLSPDRVMRVDSRKFLPSEDPIFAGQIASISKGRVLRWLKSPEWLLFHIGISFKIVLANPYEVWYIHYTKQHPE